jgi:hypothetical protein
VNAVAAADAVKHETAIKTKTMSYLKRQTRKQDNKQIKHLPGSRAAVNAVAAANAASHKTEQQSNKKQRVT